MTKMCKRVHKNEDQCDKLHKEMNMRVAPTRLEELKSFPAYILPNLDPLQKQLNQIQNVVNHETRCARRRAWRK